MIYFPRFALCAHQFSKHLFLIMCVCVVLCMFECGYHLRQEEGIRSPGAGVTH